MNSRLQTRPQTLPDTATRATLLVDDEGLIVHANTEAHALLGYSGTELVGLHFEALLPTMPRTRHAARQLRHMASHLHLVREAPIEFRARSKSGREIPVQVVLDLLPHETDRLIAATITPQRPDVLRPISPPDSRHRPRASAGYPSSSR